MTDDLRLCSPKEAVILELLAGAGQRTGLELVRASEGALTRGGIYVQLHRMEERGLVESHQVDPPPGVHGVKRRRYGVTGLGERVLRARGAALAEFGGLLPGGAS